MKVALSLGLVAASAVVGLAQQTTTTQQDGAQGPEVRREGRAGKRAKRQHRRGMRGARHGGVRAFGQLNLSDAQREQMRAIRERANGGGHAELRELMRQRRQGGQLTPEQEARARELRDGMRESRAAIRQEMLNSLTPEQRIQLEQMRRERKQRREEFRQRRMQGEPQP